jgi:O-antigen ligase
MSEARAVYPPIHDSVSGPTRDVSNYVVFFVVAAASLILLPLVWAYGEKPALLLGAGMVLAIVPAMVFLMVAYPKSIPIVLITAVHLSLFGVNLGVGPLNMRPNMLVALLAASVLGVRLVLGSARPRGLPFLTLFLSADAVYLLSTLRNSGSPFFWRGVADCSLFLVNVLQYGLIVWFLATDHKAFERAVRFSLYLSMIYTGANVLAFALGEWGFSSFERLLAYFQGETGGFARIGDLGTTEGTYIAFNVVVMLALLLLFRHNLPLPRLRLIFMLGLNCAALVLTFARGPWLAAFLTVSMLIVLLVLRLPFRSAVASTVNLAMVFVLLTVAGTGVFLSRPALAVMVVDRFTAFSALEVGTAADRIQLWENMWEDWKQAPWLGHGAHNYAKFREDPTQISENFLLELLHSAGLIGFGIFCFVIVKIVVRGLRLFSSAEGLRRMPWGLPILAGFVSMCLSSLTNPGMTGGFFWVGMALLVCAEELCLPDSKVAVWACKNA